MAEASTIQNASNASNETTPLLPDAERGTPSRCGGATPLPAARLAVLIAVRISDPIAYTQIFPYINQLLADLHVATPDQVGFYSGFIESAYSLAQLLSVYQWGRLSDIMGRRPVVMLSLTGTAIFTIAFGWSTSLIAILASRFIGGFVAGNIAVIHSMLSEMTDETNQNVAVPLFSLAWATGIIFGPLIGGTFANAATRYPTYFSLSIFVNHPYLPPCVICAALSLLGVFLTYFFVEETLQSNRKRVINDIHSGTSSCVSDRGSCPAKTQSGSTSAVALLAIPALRAITFSGFALSVMSSAFDVVFSLFCYTPVDAGGLGLQPATIGNFLAFSGTLAVLLRLSVMPYILHRFDYAATYTTCMYFWPATFVLLPLLNALALSRPSHEIGTATTEVGIWIGLAVILALSRIAAIPFTITMLLTKRHAPGGPGDAGTKAKGSATAGGTAGGSTLGKSNGLVQFAVCLGRTVGPVVVSMLFTAMNGSELARQWGIGWTWAILMACFALAGARVTKGLR